MTQIKKRAYREIDDVARYTADDFLSRLGHAIKRKLNKNSTPEDVIPLDGEPPAKKPRLDMEDGEILDGDNLPSLMASGATTPRPKSTNSSSRAELQSIDCPEIADFRKSVGQSGRSPSVHDIFPNREWECATQEIRQTAIELWKNSSDHAEAADDGLGDCSSVIIKLEHSDDAVDCFGVVVGKDGESAEAPGHSTAEKEPQCTGGTVYSVAVQTESVDGSGGLSG